MAHVPTVELPTRHAFRDLPNGVDESCPLDFHSPYGCSKGAADQYVRDYSRIYGLPTIVFRQSCIYGPRQMGVEDQGWVAWFLIALIMGRPITIFGDGKQLRDLLYVDDLLRAFDLAIDQMRPPGGRFIISGAAQPTRSQYGGSSSRLPRRCSAIRYPIRPLCPCGQGTSLSSCPTRRRRRATSVGPQPSRSSRGSGDLPRG